MLGESLVDSNLWDFKSYDALKQVKCLLKLLEVPNAMDTGWKAFRAGRATAMAAAGDDLGSIRTAGEWKSRAFLSYIDKTSVDKARLLDQALSSSDEDE